MLPAALRKRDRVLTGQIFVIKRLKAGQYLLKRDPVRDNEGLVDWLLACPEKDWFRSLEASSTDTL
jgi:hypothetical protein